MVWSTLEEIQKYEQVGSLEYRKCDDCYFTNHFSMRDDDAWVDKFIEDIDQIQVKVSEFHIIAKYLKKILIWREYNPLSSVSEFNK